MAANYYLLSHKGRRSTVRQFSDLALQKDEMAAKAGFDGLAQVEHFREEVRTMISPPILRRLATEYIGLVQRGKMSRRPKLQHLLEVN